MKKYVYLFTEGDAGMRELLGGKGANLAEMTKIGLPVPQGFTVTTEACTQYFEDGRKINDEIRAQILEYIGKLEDIVGKKFADKENPLLVSVRSGARASMPGMMDTILNLGLNEEVVHIMGEKSNNPRWAWDCYRRFIQMFSDVVMGVGKKYFETLIDELKEREGISEDVEMTAENLEELANQFKAEYKKQIGKDFPDDPHEQLFMAIEAVFRSWDNPRADVYRMDHNIPYSWGTAVNVQMMAFGNLGEDSGTGVAFTRNSSTGEKGLMGEFLMNAQGEDVVAGVRTPQPLEKLGDILPDVYKQLQEITGILENHYRDMQDMEFTIEHEKLYMLQTRNGKRTAGAAIKIACDLMDEDMISEEKALTMIDAQSLNMLLHPQFDQKALDSAEPIGQALPASPGAAVGKIVFHADDAAVLGQKGEKVILVRLETSPEDIEGMKFSEGILTARGGQTSHAAIIARGLGTCCVSGCEELILDEEGRKFTLNGKTYNEGDVISLDGSTGKIYEGEIKLVPADLSNPDFKRIMDLASKYKELKVRCNADTPKDAKQAISFGAEGIGLCRTEHMFFDEERIGLFREMILAESVEEREAALAKLQPIQQQDFEELFEAMEGRPVTIRFLDPPLHEFMPVEESEFKKLAEAKGTTVEHVKQVVKNLHEFNPMIGHRGCRLSVTYPEITAMQTRAIVKAALAVNERHPEFKIVPEMMIPLVVDPKEFKFVADIVTKTTDEEIAAAGSDMKYKVGTMIETPRAALLADEIGEMADFFSFGSNDLTQMTFGISRDDSEHFIPAYYEKKIFESDPFVRLDREGVGRLMKNTVTLGRQANETIHIGICGEHGGDASSIDFFHEIGLDYVSCSPFRVPIARLAAAQAAINSKK